MADGVFKLAAADYGKPKVLGSLITTIELRAGGEASDQYQSLGPIAEGSLKINPRSQMRAGNMPTLFGYDVEVSVKVLANGTNMRTAINKIIANFTEARITTVDGHKVTFAGTTSTTVGEIDFTVTEEWSGDFEQARFILLTGTGFLTSTRYTAIYAEA